MERSLEPSCAAVTTKRPAFARTVALAPLAVQLLVLVVHSYHRYRHYNLSLDFAIFHQAWHQIASGRLSPQITVSGFPYWRSHFELVMWLLAPLRWLYPHPVILLWLQDTATVAAEAVAIWWAADILERRRRDDVERHEWTLPVPLLAVALLAALNPWIYLASAQDFHLEALGVLFAVLAARDIWSGRLRRSAVWIALTLITGDVSGTYVTGIGLSVLAADRRRWRLGLAVMGTGIGWIALAAALHANRGSGADSYAWLIDGGLRQGVTGAFAIVGGIALHPSKAVSVLVDRWHLVLNQVVPVGTVGVAAPWVAGPIALVLLENALNHNVFFIRPSYQDLPVYVFALTGTAVLIDVVARRWPSGWRPVATVVVTAGVVVAAAHFDLTRNEPVELYRVDGPTAKDLDRVTARVPTDAEVIASFGIVGRFAGRREIYLHYQPNQVMPVAAHRVVFVFAPWAGNQPIPPDRVMAAVQYVRSTLGAQPLLAGPNVFAYMWTPPPGTQTVTLSAPGT